MAAGQLERVRTGVLQLVRARLLNATRVAPGVAQFRPNTTKHDETANKPKVQSSLGQQTERRVAPIFRPATVALAAAGLCARAQRAGRLPAHTTRSNAAQPSPQARPAGAARAGPRVGRCERIWRRFRLLSLATCARVAQPESGSVSAPAAPRRSAPLPARPTRSLNSPKVILKVDLQLGAAPLRPPRSLGRKQLCQGGGVCVAAHSAPAAATQCARPPQSCGAGARRAPSQAGTLRASPPRLRVAHRRASSSGQLASQCVGSLATARNSIQAARAQTHLGARARPS